MFNVFEYSNCNCYFLAKILKDTIANKASYELSFNVVHTNHFRFHYLQQSPDILLDPMGIKFNSIDSIYANKIRASSFGCVWLKDCLIIWYQDEIVLRYMYAGFFHSYFSIKEVRLIVYSWNWTCRLNLWMKLHHHTFHTDKTCVNLWMYYAAIAS